MLIDLLQALDVANRLEVIPQIWKGQCQLCPGRPTSVACVLIEMLTLLLGIETSILAELSTFLICREVTCSCFLSDSECADVLSSLGESPCEWEQAPA